MSNFISNQIAFYLSLAVLLFLPGYFFLLAVWGRNYSLISRLERFVISFGLSIIMVDFMMIIFGRTGVRFTRLSILAGTGLMIIFCYVVYRLRFRKEKYEKEKNSRFTKNQLVSFFLILFLAVFLRTVYLESAVLPSSTDLGHHMYWSKMISESGQLPDYAARDVVQVDGNYEVSAPKKISDIIIGEHLIFSAVNLVTGLNFISYFPVLLLYLINIMSLLALFILSIRLFSNSKNNLKIAIITLFFIGPIFALSPPQAKYIGGGVVGNILGNLLLPLAFYFFVRFLKEKDRWLFVLALLFSMGIFYTHHMTGFILLLSLLLFLLFYIIFNFRDCCDLFLHGKKYFLNAPVIGFVVFAVVFVLVIYIPSYITNNAVSTVVGEVTKIEHTGLTLRQLQDAVGEPRLALSIIAVFLFFMLSKNIGKNERLLLSAWVAIIILIALEPALIKINIPSGRVANYAAYPLSLMSAFVLVELSGMFKFDRYKFLPISQKVAVPALILVFIYLLTKGLGDNAANLANRPDPAKAMNVFHAAQYLAPKTETTENVLTDHVYIAADSWMKLFFMRDYNFPFFRANFERYENKVDKKEMCTLNMISNPESAESKKCFTDLDMEYIVVDRMIDGPQFERTDDFSKIYSGPVINIYKKNF